MKLGSGNNALGRGGRAALGRWIASVFTPVDDRAGDSISESRASVATATPLTPEPLVGSQSPTAGATSRGASSESMAILPDPSTAALRGSSTASPVRGASTIASIATGANGAETGGDTSQTSTAPDAPAQSQESDSKGSRH